MWRRIAGGVHLTRKIDRLILDAGFRFTESDQGYGICPRPMAYLYRGVARLVRGSAAIAAPVAADPRGRRRATRHRRPATTAARFRRHAFPSGHDPCQRSLLT